MNSATHCHARTKHPEDRPPACQRHGAFSLDSSDQGQRPRSIDRPEAHPPLPSPRSLLRSSTRFAVLAVSLCSAVIPAIAGPRTSANYTITTDTAGSGGNRATSAACTNDGSAGGVVGISTVASPAETVKSGFIGQLYEVDHLHINSAPPDTIAELGTKQLSLIQILTDDSVLAVNLAQVAWTTEFGPVIPVDVAGVAHAGAVYQDTLWQFRADYEGQSAIHQLIILNNGSDDIPGSGYAGDGIDDAWQVQYFGLNNPNAGPTADPDHDGQDNRFEFLADLDPNSATSRFVLTNARPAGQPGQMNIAINPRFNNRTYTVKSSPTLGNGAVWTPLTGFTISDNGQTRTITDTTAAGARKFYMIEITKP